MNIESQGRALKAALGLASNYDVCRPPLEAISMSKTVAINQSNYIPWKGYFDMINMVDLFIFHDDVQYTKQDWRNRNLIKTPRGPAWLTVPCGADERRLICEVQLKDPSWQLKHWRVIESNYAHAKYFQTYREFFREIYLGTQWQSLSVMNQFIIIKIAKEILRVETKFDDSRNYHLKSKKADRVKELLSKSHGTHYVSGPAGKQYLSEESLAEIDVAITWMDYDLYPEYPQLYPPFHHQVSIIDLLFNVGPRAPEYMKSFSMGV